VNSTTRLIRIAHIVGAVADETRDAIDANHPPAGRYVEVAGPVDPGARSAPAPVPPPGRHRRFARRHGNVVLAVDAGRLVQLARRHDCVLELVPRVGEYVGTGRPLYRVYGDDRPSDVELQRLTQLGRERTLYQDPAYGIRQLVDIAAQALSPAINAPTTAVQVIDRLADLLGEIGGRPDPTGLVLDRDRRLRLLVPVAGWPSLVELAFTEIRTFGARSPQVSRRLAAALSDLSDVLPAERRAPLERQRALLFETLALPGGEPGERVEDRLGLG
jgi:uncharacterized membrane protein